MPKTLKVLILYYSQTGNTQKVARAIRDGLRAAGHEVVLKFLLKASAEDLQGYDLIGFGSPVWYEMPPNLRRFVEEMPRLDGKLAFSFCTHGTLPALYFPLAIPRLQRKGLTVIDWKNWYGNCSIQIFPEPYYTAGHPDELDLADAQAFGRSVAEKALRILAGETGLIPAAPRPDMLPMHANAAIDHLGGFHNVHGRLVRDPFKCLYPKCRICMDHCTMRYIDLAAVPAKFGSEGVACDDCHGCTYCEMLCPTGAIQPVVPYEEAAPVGKDHGMALFTQVLAQAEADGQFRRLLALQDVGTKTPFYSVHHRHPRLKALSFKDDNGGE
jgi:Pyruvate/2-oxoacid:ferredoxin oxidoreductase delta subunit